MRLGLKLTPTQRTVGGSQMTLAQHLLPALRALHPDLVLLTDAPEAFGPVAADLPVVRVRSPFLAAGRAAKLSAFIGQHLLGAQAARRAGCDVIFCPYTYEVQTVAAVPQVVMVHDLVPLHYPEQFRATATLWRTVYLPALQRVAAVVTNSEHTQDDLLVHSRLAPERVRVVGFGFTPSQSEAPRPEGVGDGPYLLYVASTWYPHKNLIGLLNAYARLKDKLPQRLVIVGQPVPRFAPAIERTLAELRLGPRVVLLSNVPNTELGRLYRHASLFVYPSLFEGFGIPPLEAMANDVPVVAARAAAIPEVCGDAAHYVPPGDEAALTEAIWQGLTDEPLRARLRQAGRERIGHFTWAAMAERVLAVCQAAARHN